jgi:3-oxoadipate enol-lactonase
LRYIPAAVIGFSLGGMVAQTLALDHPNDVNALVSAACGSTFSEEVRRALRERGDYAMRHGMASILESTAERWFSAPFREHGGDAAALRRLLANDTQSWRQAWYAIAELNTAPRLHEIAVPTLCMAGEEDVSTPPKMVQDVAKAISGASFAVIPKMPHMLFIEDPQAVAKVITKFLKAHLFV